MLWSSLKAPRRGTFNEYPKHVFSLRNKQTCFRIIIKYTPLTSPLNDIL